MNLDQLNRWMTLVANLGVVAGILFLGVELQQNTTAVQAQTRDSITDKQMAYYSWYATNETLAQIVVTATTLGVDTLTPVHQRMWNGFSADSLMAL